MLHTLQKLVQKMKQIFRPQHTEDFLQLLGKDWGRKEGARGRDGKGWGCRSESVRTMRL